MIMYIYALFGFAVMRTIFDPGEQQYCQTLYECSMSIIRYGFIGDYNDVSIYTTDQGLSQDLENGRPKLAIVNYKGGLFFKGDSNVFRFQP